MEYGGCAVHRIYRYQCGIPVVCRKYLDVLFYLISHFPDLHSGSRYSGAIAHTGHENAGFRGVGHDFFVDHLSSLYTVAGDSPEMDNSLES